MVGLLPRASEKWVLISGRGWEFGSESDQDEGLGCEVGGFRGVWLFLTGGLLG